ncbi:MAG TPA: hypothetical protein VIL37_05060 [Natronosporangium sp.]
MRHLWSLLAGVVAAPLAWLCLSTGQYRSSQTVAEWNQENFFDTAELIAPAAFLVAAGIVLGLIGTLRWSPVGPLVAGLLLVVPTVFMFIDPFRTLDAFSLDQPRRLFEQDYQPWLPVENGTLLVLGSLLLMAVFSAQRWRRWPASATAASATAAPVAGTDSTGQQPASMTDEEILAAAAALEEEERATAGQPNATEEPPAEPATESEPASEPAPATASETESESGGDSERSEPDNDEASAKSGTSAK